MFWSIFQFKMDGSGKKPLETVITNFHKLHMNKGKEYWFKNFKKFGVHKATIGESIDGWKRLKKMEIVTGKKWKERSMPQMKMD